MSEHRYGLEFFLLYFKSLYSLLCMIVLKFHHSEFFSYVFSLIIIVLIFMPVFLARGDKQGW